MPEDEQASFGFKFSYYKLSHMSHLRRKRKGKGQILAYTQKLEKKKDEIEAFILCILDSFSRKKVWVKFDELYKTICVNLKESNYSCVSKRTVRRYLSTLKEQGKILSPKKGYYKLTKNELRYAHSLVKPYRWKPRARIAINVPLYEKYLKIALTSQLPITFRKMLEKLNFSELLGIVRILQFIDKKGGIVKKDEIKSEKDLKYISKASAFGLIEIKDSEIWVSESGSIFLTFLRKTANINENGN
jgi:hypothetical protein